MHVYDIRYFFVYLFLYLFIYLCISIVFFTYLINFWYYRYIYTFIHMHKLKGYWHVGDEEHRRVDERGKPRFAALNSDSAAGWNCLIGGTHHWIERFTLLNDTGRRVNGTATAIYRFFGNALAALEACETVGLRRHWLPFNNLQSNPSKKPTGHSREWVTYLGIYVQPSKMTPVLAQCVSQQFWGASFVKNSCLSSCCVYPIAWELQLFSWTH